MGRAVAVVFVEPESIRPGPRGRNPARTMPAMLKRCEPGTVHAIARSVHLAALGLWLGAMVMMGVAAAVAFPTMRGLEPQLPAFAGYPKDHWAIAAGHIMNTLFAVGDWLGLVLGLIALAAIAVPLCVGVRRMATPLGVLRSVATVLAMLIALASLVLMRPGMNADLNEFWAAARAGEVARADVARSRFDAMHPKASLVLSAQAGIVFVALLLSAADIRAGRTREPEPGVAEEHG